MRTSSHTWATLLLAALVLPSCGKNLLTTGEAKDPAQDAAIALERGDEDAAIEILEDALEGDPENPQFLSVLSAAYAQRAGVEPLTIAQGMSSESESESEDEGGQQSGNAMLSLFSVMPDATTDSLADIDKAVLILAGVPVAQWMPGDPFKIAIYQTASMIMHMKILDTNGDGTLSLEEITNLSDLSATGLLGQLASAQAALGGNPDDETMQKASASLATYQTQIDASPGATPEEKLRNYMAQTNAQ